MEVRGNYEVFPISQTIHEPSIDGLSIVDEDIKEEGKIELSRTELIERYATIQNISFEEAEAEIGAPTEEEILKNIQDKTIEKIKSRQIPMNRAQRRALKKRVGAKKYAEMVNEAGEMAVVSEMAQKLNYIDLIQKLRKLNEKKEKENGEAINEDN